MVSIIIPHYNRSLVIAETIESVRAQTYSDWQIIIVDDNSNQQEWDSLIQYSNEKIKIFKREGEQRGASACRNFGITRASGAFIIFLDSDDLLEDFCLEQRVMVMEQNQNLDWAVFQQYALKEGIPPRNLLFTKPLKTKESAIQYFLQLDPPWQTMAVIWKKNTFEINGVFDETLFYMEDPDLHLRALLNEGLNVSIEFNLPPDSFYRLNEMDDLKAISFYRLSIQYRFQFLYKTVKYLSAQPIYFHKYLPDLRKGYNNFIKLLLLSRLKEYEKEFNEMNEFLKEYKILSILYLFKLKILQKVFLSNSTIIKILRLKGFFYKSIM